MVIDVENSDLQDAIEGAPPGATVRADPVIQHTIEEPLVVDTAGLTIRGIDLRLADGANVNMIEILADGVTLSEFVLDGNRDNQTDDYTDSGVVVGRAMDITVEQGHISDVDRHGIVIGPPSPPNRSNKKHEMLAETAASNITVRDVRVDAPRRDGCSVQGFAVSNVRVDGVSTFGSRDRGGVEVKDGASSIMVTGCYAEDCVYGVTVQDHGDYGVNGVVIAHNTAVACNRAVHSQTTGRHENVVVIGNVGHEISGVSTQKYPAGAIYLGLIDGLIVANNSIDSTGEAGLHVYDTPNVQITGNRIETVSDGPGIAVTDSPGAIVNTNIVRNASGDGILYRATRGEMFDHAPISTAGPLEGAQICHNRCVGNDGHGVALRPGEGAIDYHIVTENSLRGNDGGGVNDAEAREHGIVRSNVV